MSVIPSRNDGSVYFIVDVTEPQISRVKIGYSLNPCTRWRQLERKYPERVLNLYAEIPGDMGHERALHERFASDALGHEWFRPSGRVMAFVSAADHFDNFYTPKLCGPAPCRACRTLLRFYGEVAA